MTRAEAFVEAARRYIGVRWHHLGRTAEGVDCVGLLLLAAEDAGMPHDHPPAYPRGQRGYDLVEAVGLMGERIRISDSRDGDILVFADGLFPAHVGLRTSRDGVACVLHAHAGRRRVMEEPLANHLAEALRVCVRPHALKEA